jgi:hypothetical protein
MTRIKTILLSELESDRFRRFLIDRDPSSKINSVFPKYIDCTGFFPENDLFYPQGVEVQLDYFKEGEGWFHSEEFHLWGWRALHKCELKHKEGKALLPLKDLLESVIWTLTYGNKEDRDPELAKRLKRASRLRLRFGRVVCERKRLKK